MTMRARVRAALDAQKPADRDVAAAELALNYARLMDAAAPRARYATALRWLEGLDIESEDGERARDVIRAALAEHSVASDLGPKLLAALTELGLTPRARADVAKGGNDGKPAAGALDQLALRRAGRGRPTGVDAGAP